MFFEKGIVMPSKPITQTAMQVLKWYDYTTILIALEDYEARKNKELNGNRPNEKIYAKRHIEELLPLRNKLHQLREIASEANCFQHGYINE